MSGDILRRQLQAHLPLVSFWGPKMEKKVSVPSGVDKLESVLIISALTSEPKSLEVIAEETGLSVSRAYILLRQLIFAGEARHRDCGFIKPPESDQT